MQAKLRQMLNTNSVDQSWESAFEQCMADDEVVLAEIIGRVLYAIGKHEVKNILHKLIKKQLKHLDDYGKIAYHYREINMDGNHWLKLWEHLQVTRVDALGKECRQALAWLLVHLAITKETGMLPHEQNFLTATEKWLWQIIQPLFVCDEAKEMAVNAPLVSVMIPTCNMPEIFARTLRSAAIQDYPRLEIIVCDNISLALSRI